MRSQKLVGEYQIVRLLQRHLVGAQFTGTVYGTEVTTTQAAVIGELVRRTQPSVKELATLIRVNISTISRTLSQLQKMGFITSHRDVADNRRSIHRCTERGHEFVTLMWNTVEGLIARRIEGFTKHERVELEDFLEVFAGVRALSSLVALPHDSKLGLAWRALTYSHGVAGSNYAGSGYSVTDWAVLSEIYYRQRTPAELADLMRVSRSTVSVKLRMMVERDLIHLQKAVLDKRGRILTLTQKGEATLSHIELSAAELFHQNLKHLSPQKLARGISLLQRYVEALYPSARTRGTITVVNDSDRAAYRRRAWLRCEHGRMKYPLSGFFFHDKHPMFRITDATDGELLCEVATDSEDTFVLVNLVSLKDSEEMRDVIMQIPELLGSFLDKTVILPKEWRNYIKELYIAS